MITIISYPRILSAVGLFRVITASVTSNAEDQKKKESYAFYHHI